MDNILFNNVTTILSSLSSVAIIISAFFAIYQWRKTKKLNGVKYLQQLREKLYDDKEISEVIYMFDYNEKWYSIEFHETKEMQTKVDRTLSVLEHASYLKMKKHIDKNQFLVIRYQVDRTLCNSQVQAYLFNLYHWSKRTNIPMPFSYLVKYGLHEGYIRKDFKNVNSQIYKRYLNI